jgi:outer membrane protein insertion porin family
MAVTLELEDVAWNVPVTYDNFIWFTDDELTKAVRDALASFEGAAPESGAAIDIITSVLTQALQKRGVASQVDYKPLSEIGGKAIGHIFAVKNPGVKLCALHVDGASAVAESELLDVARSAVGADYSRFQLARFARLTMTQPYRRRGYWRAAFQPPMAAAGSPNGCDGAIVTMHVDEGTEYRFDRSEWTGNTAIPSATLDSIIGLKPGDVADGSKIDSGLQAIEVAHRKLGYLNERASVTPTLDDATRRVTFKYTVSEGPQYRMGVFKVVGLAPKDQEALTKQWKLQPGDVYDASYLAEFRSTVLRPYAAPPRQIAEDVSGDAATHVVNVTLTVR